jgi:hypothetical protein
MKAIDLGTSPTTLSEVLDLAGQDNLILRTPDGREFVVAEVGEFENEVAFVRQNAALTEFLARRAEEPGKYSLADVKARLGIK